MREMLRAPVREVVAVDRRHHHVLECQLAHGLRHVGGFEGIQLSRAPCGDVAEAARPSADFAHDHHRRVLLGPALADVRAGGFLTDSGKLVLPHDLPRLVVRPGNRGLDPDPGGLAPLYRIVRPVRLFGVTYPGLRLDVAMSLEVYGPTKGVKDALVHHFREGRVREDAVHQFGFRRLEIHRHDVALDQFGHLSPHHVGAQQLAGLCVVDRLDQAVGFPKRDGLAVSDEGEAPYLHLVSGFLSLLFRQSHRSDLGMAVGTARDQVLVERMYILTGNGLDAQDTLVAGLVCQHRRAGHVTDGVDARLLRAAEAVGHDDASLDLHPGAFEVQVLDVADDSNGGNHVFDLDRLALALLRLDRAGDQVRALFQLADLRRGQNLDALLLQTLPCVSGNFLVLCRQDLRQQLDDGDLGAESAEETGELDADRPRPSDQERLRHALGHHRLEVGPDLLLVGLDARQHARTGAGRQDDVLGLIVAVVAVLVLDLNFPRPVQAPLALDDGHLVLFEKMPDAAVELLRDVAGPLHDPGNVEGDIFGGQAEISGPLHVVKDFRAAQERLGRDAPPIQADAAEMLTLHHCGLHPELSRPDCRNIAPGSGADHDQVEAGLRHAAPPLQVFTEAY